MFTYNENENKIVYEPSSVVDLAQLLPLAGKFTTLVKLVVEAEVIKKEYVYELETILNLPPT